MTPIPRLVGMVHLPPLPGSPGFTGSMGVVVANCTAEAKALADAGFPALLGVATAPVDSRRATAFVETAREHGPL